MGGFIEILFLCLITVRHSVAMVLLWLMVRLYCYGVWFAIILLLWCIVYGSLFYCCYGVWFMVRLYYYGVAMVYGLWLDSVAMVLLWCCYGVAMVYGSTLLLWCCYGVCSMVRFYCYGVWFMVQLLCNCYDVSLLYSITLPGYLLLFLLIYTASQFIVVLYNNIRTAMAPV